MRPTVLLWLAGLFGLTVPSPAATPEPRAADPLTWQRLPDLDDPLGVAGPFVGVHEGALIVAGGANFPAPRWESQKEWHREIRVLPEPSEGEPVSAVRWVGGFLLDRPLAYGACATTSLGVACLGGHDGAAVRSECFLLSWDPVGRAIRLSPLPPLPGPCAYGAAAAIDDVIYLAGGQYGPGLDSAMGNLWRLDLSEDRDPSDAAWEELPAWPGPPRAFAVVAAQHNGFTDCIYVIGGRHAARDPDGSSRTVFLSDVWELDPVRLAPGRDASSTSPWRRRRDAPSPLAAGTGLGLGQAHVAVLSGADGSLFGQEDALRDRHPGFPRRAWLYHTITDRWVDAGETPANQVTTPAVAWRGGIVIASGEVRPRTRTRAVWLVEPARPDAPFGAANFSVLTVYLLAMVGVGLWFAGRNRDTNDYFRGGQRIPWWVAGCSIFATMLSSITYMAIPAKAYAQDWVYLIGNLTILAVAPVAVYIALPFFRQIDATSAYEYLERRFNRPVRLFASASFTIFHVFRIGIVLSLAALALGTVTPLSAAWCVVIMGGLSIVYCTLGGVGAVVWTDTIQTFVLLGGAVLCFVLMVASSDGGVAGFLSDAASGGKFHCVNLHLDPTSASVALWVVVLGAIGQNVSSYTSDQAVVQRYMTTPDGRRAARAIWTNGILAVGASVLFFAVGSGLWTFYRSHPERLDPTFMTDQIFPLFISRELPPGIAGLIVAGIFAAAQSTVSTSMNSTATAVVVDFLRPLRVASSEGGYLRWARVLTLLLGVVGTLLGLLFVDPDIKSLFDQFIRVIGLFMGVLGGLFMLGILTRRAHGRGALIGAVGGAAVVGVTPLVSNVHGFLYAAIGVSACFAIGYVASSPRSESPRDLDGLTIYTIRAGTSPERTESPQDPGVSSG